MGYKSVSTVHDYPDQRSYGYYVHAEHSLVASTHHGVYAVNVSMQGSMAFDAMGIP